MQLALEMGALYSGEQLTNTGSFKIEMKIDSIDLDQEIMYGTFQIYNITDKYELLSSFFESIIIGSKHSFNETESDTVHWGMFPEWRSNFETNNNSEFIYMKIKELFLLPDPKIKSIPGASIEVESVKVSSSLVEDCKYSEANLIYEDSSSTELREFNIELIPELFRNEEHLMNVYNFIKSRESVQFEELIETFGDVDSEKVVIYLDLLKNKKFIKRKNNLFYVEKEMRF
ncbi:hypothetical protein NBO_22g0004, partial [Nosema bombycis CQ1]